MPKYGAISLDIKDGIAHVLVERPPVNAFSDALVAELNSVLTTVEESTDVSVLHFKSGLKVFSAGADLEQIQDSLSTAEGRDSIIEAVRDMQRLFARIENLGVVSVAEIAGAAVGGGLEFALCCDLRIASEKAKLGLPEAGLGLLPAAGGTQRLTRICGEAVARRLILGAELIDGEEALRLGLVHWAVAPDELAGQVEEIASRVAAIPPDALAACKRCIAAASNQAVDGFELELTETRRLHDGGEPAQRIEEFLARSG
jgi:enoyl-CoA hydratase/carnithine racemase